MIYPDYIFVVIIIALVVLSLQIFSSFISYDIYLFNRQRKGWIGIIVANAIIASQDFIFIVYIHELEALNFLTSLTFILLPLSISIFMLIGLISMKNNFVKFDVINNETFKKINMINQKKVKTKRKSKS